VAQRAFAQFPPTIVGWLLCSDI